MIKPKFIATGLMTLYAISLPLHISGDSYPINYPIGTQINSSHGRSLKAISLSSPSDGTQSISITQTSDRLLYHDKTDYCFSAIIGETVTATFDWEGSWMHGYVYLDQGNDGTFDCELEANSSIPAGSDVMSFSNYDSYNSAGTSTGNGNVGVNPPSFTIPEQLTPGLYRMRYKIDWNSIDPGGNCSTSTLHQQLITTNEGAIADILIYVHKKAEGNVALYSDHGNVTASDGTPLSDIKLTAGQDFTITILPDENYMTESITVESGYDNGNPEVAFASQALGKRSMTIPAYLITDNTFTIPGEYIYGDISLHINYTECGNEPEEGNYESSVDGEKDATDGITSVTFTTDSESKTIEISTTQRHFFYDDAALPVLKGSTIEPSVTYGGTQPELRLYIDADQDGVFSDYTGEMISSTASGNTLPAFTLSTLLPTGVYRCRIKAGDNCEVEFLINIHEAEGNIDVDIQNGYAFAANRNPLNNTIAFGGSLSITPQPTLPGFEAEYATVRHGHNLNGEQYIRGNRQWDELTIPIDETSVIPSENIDGDILIMADFEETADSEWTKIWSDEFDSEELDITKWSYHPRQSATWNRLIATDNEIPYVNKFEDGVYKSYCIATPSEFTDETQPMISGAIYSADKFYMTGGKIEARIKTTAHTGNFPAFWMMPQAPGTGWPMCGEIDIWEQIDNENKSYHTIHSAWTYKSYGSVSQNSPTSSGSYYTDSSLWHIYSLEWDSNEYLKWYVDNQLVFTYNNAHFSSGQYTEDMTWPFAKAFYVIINQSVGNGSWAQNCDPTFDYLTQFDYVRAYQKKDAKNYYSKADESDGIDNIVSDVYGNGSLSESPAIYYNLQGIKVNAERLTKGIYIRKQGSKTDKIIIR